MSTSAANNASWTAPESAMAPFWAALKSPHLFFGTVTSFDAGFFG